ncbi:hypothetical protein FF011L_44680 [Roseimaritima multifibrata]|uniref:Uncharacterized protein n=1 Tax=Roseimaritima multifibrata TaxID=1930274 RepID=A0A517MLA6_9BACT|nr:hypothetical protein [Roseimaritima multifibrata]QDS95668.1 hypothetical protein FF011L_44680 [Roseimaritima multifibrata]
MEPFHQLRIPNAVVADVNAELKAIGLTLTHQSDSWLGSKQPHLRDVICECMGRRTVLAVGLDPKDKSRTLIVYVNRGDDSLSRDVRAHFEALGASWGYFDD